MNVLMIGAGKGSWAMRGVQLGRAIGARVTTVPTHQDWSWADLVVLVKRAAVQWANEAKACSVPVVWDALDFWAQPEHNQDSRESLIAHADSIKVAAGVSLVIGATKAMAEDLGGVYLPHQCRVNLQATPIKAKADMVGYDGAKKYLGSWGPALEHACGSLGLEFVVNPADLRDVDVFVSFRDGKWDGWVCRQWKSGVKHVNAITAGRPMVSQLSAGYAELKPCGATAESQADLVSLLQMACEPAVRQHAYELGRQRSREFRLDTIAAQYLCILERAAERRAA